MAASWRVRCATVRPHACASSCRVHGAPSGRNGSVDAVAAYKGLAPGLWHVLGSAPDPGLRLLDAVARGTDVTEDNQHLV
jgi:hypothetical protein